MSKHLFLILCVTLQVALTKAQSQSFTLNQAQQYAVENNQTVKNARLDLEKADHKVWETTAIGLPQINAEANFTHFIDIPTQVLPNFISPVVDQSLLNFGLITDSQRPAGYDDVEAQFGTKFNASAGVTASQLIFDGSYIVALKSTKVFKNISSQSLEKTEMNIKTAVAQAYYNVVVAEHNKTILDSTKMTMDEILDQTQVIRDNGLAEQQDVDQLSLTVSAIDNAIKRAEAQLSIAKQLLKMQMGVTTAGDIQLSYSMDTLLSASNSEALLNKTYNIADHIDHKIIENQVLANELLLKNQKAGYLPSLAAFFTHQQQGLRNEFNYFDGEEKWFPSTYWGLSLKVPVFSGGMRRSKEKQAQLELTKSQNTLQQVDQALQFRIAKAKSDYGVAFSIYESEKKNIELAENIMASIEEKKKVGLASSMDVAQARNQYLATEGNYIKALFEILNAKAELDNVFNNY